MSKPPELRKAELVQAARVLFNQNGVEKTKISDIVAKVGVAQGVFYYYFQSKKQVVDEVLLQVRTELQTNINRILQEKNQNFGHKMFLLIELYLDLVDQFLADDETSTMTLEKGLLQSNEIARESREIIQKGIVQLVEAGAKNKEIPILYPTQTAWVLLFGFEELASRNIPGRAEIYAIAEQSLGLTRGELGGYWMKK